MRIGKVRIYFDWRDWWVGYFRGSQRRMRTHYVCPLPCLVISWPMKDPR
jgi:hypothetical protein